MNMTAKKKKKDQTLVDVLKWCETQEEQTKKTIDYLLDNKEWTDKDVKKALTLTSKILKNVDELKEILLGIIIK